MLRFSLLKFQLFLFGLACAVLIAQTPPSSKPGQPAPVPAAGKTAPGKPAPEPGKPAPAGKTDAPAPEGGAAPAEGAVVEGEVEGEGEGEVAPVEEAPVDPNAWKEEREQHHAEVKEAVKQWMKENFARSQVIPRLAAGLAKSWPEIVPSWKELDAKKEVRAPGYFQRGDKGDRPGLIRAREELRDELMQQYLKENPPKRDEILIAEGKKKYPMYHLDDMIPEPGVQLRGGLGMNTYVAGRFRIIDPMRVNIGGRWVHRMDLSEDTQALFYEDMNAKLVQEYVNHEKLLYSAQQGVWVDNEMDEKLPVKWMRAWYVPIKKRPNSHRFINPEAWKSRKAFMDELYNSSRAAQEKKKLAELTKQKFEDELQWIFVKEEKDYMPAEAYERWQQEQTKEKKQE